MRRRWVVLGTAITGYWLWWRRHGTSVDLTNKVVLITGASSGIGRATAHAFAAAGADLVLSARRADRLETLEQELECYSRSVLTVQADTAKDDDIERLVQAAVERFGHIDVLVNNAGQWIGGLLQDNDPAAIRDVMDVNFYGAVRLTRAVLPHMLERNRGHIVNVASIAGLVQSPGNTVYAGTKAGLIGFTEAVRHELSGTDMRVTIVLPGWTRTEMIEHLNESEMRGAGLLNPFTATIDMPETIAQTIVGAVIHNRQRVITGDLPLQLAFMLQGRIIPFLLDIGLDVLLGWYPRDKYLRLMGEISRQDTR